MEPKTYGLNQDQCPEHKQVRFKSQSKPPDSVVQICITITMGGMALSSCSHLWSWATKDQDKSQESTNLKPMVRRHVYNLLP